MVKVAHDAGLKITMSLSTTFGCPFEGHVHEDVVLDFVERFVEAGIDGISLADTTGMANPRQVRELTRSVLERVPAARRDVLHAALPQHARHGARERRRRASRRACAPSTAP